MSESDGSGVKSAERALTILELFSRPGRALTFTQVAEQLGYPRSSLHGLLRTLTARGWLRLDPATRRFSLGLRAWELGAAQSAADLARRAQPLLDRLHQDLGGAVSVAVLDGEDSVTVASSRGERARRAPAHAVAWGRVLLAESDRAGRDLDGVRSQGWAEDDAAQPPSLAVPVRDAGGCVVAALALHADGLGAESREKSLRCLRQGAEQLASALSAAG